MNFNSIYVIKCLFLQTHYKYVCTHMYIPMYMHTANNFSKMYKFFLSKSQIYKSFRARSLSFS